jgi:hypothetical protein
MEPKWSTKQYKTGTKSIGHLKLRWKDHSILQGNRMEQKVQTDGNDDDDDDDDGNYDDNNNDYLYLYKTMLA